jgi:hypothetical protein
MAKNTNLTLISERTTKDYIFFQWTTKELQHYARDYTSILHPERTTVVPKGLHLVTLFTMSQIRHLSSSFSQHTFMFTFTFVTYLEKIFKPFRHIINILCKLQYATTHTYARLDLLLHNIGCLHPRLQESAYTIKRIECECKGQNSESSLCCAWVTFTFFHFHLLSPM